MSFLINITELFFSSLLVFLPSGGFYSIEQKDRPTIVVLNTNYMASDKDPFGQWKWLEKVLQDVRQKRSTVSLYR